jgi:hypothetical protein
MNLKKSSLLMATFCCGVSSHGMDAFFKDAVGQIGAYTAYITGEAVLLWVNCLVGRYLDSTGNGPHADIFAAGSLGAGVGYFRGKALGDIWNSKILKNYSTVVACIGALLGGSAASWLACENSMKRNSLWADILRTAAFWANNNSLLSLPATIAASYVVRNLLVGAPIFGFAAGYYGIKQFLTKNEYGAFGGAAAIAGVAWGGIRFTRLQTWLPLATLTYEDRLYSLGRL